MNKIYIFGAHSRAQTLGFYLTYLNSDIEIEAYFFDNEEANPEFVGKVPVINLNDVESLNVEFPVYVGTRGIFHNDIEKKLSSLGFRNIIPLSVDMDLKLRNQYLSHYYLSVNREFIKFETLNNAKETDKKSKVYIAKSVFDKELNSEYRISDYEKEIQVGSSLTDERLYEGIITDNTGENISEKNRQYCELTALYWIWKNAAEDVVGLVHYRRHFILPDNWINNMVGNNVDVILPIPLYVNPSVEDNFVKRHDKKIWDTTLEILKEKHTCFYVSAKKYFEGNLYSPCNMFIMKKEILNEYCSWLFPILFELEERIGVIDDRYLNRYPGFVAERLLSAYFEINREKYKIVYADKNFLM